MPMACLIYFYINIDLEHQIIPQQKIKRKGGREGKREGEREGGRTLNLNPKASGLRIHSLQILPVSDLLRE